MKGLVEQQYRLDRMYRSKHTPRPYCGVSTGVWEWAVSVPDRPGPGTTSSTLNPGICLLRHSATLRGPSCQGRTSGLPSGCLFIHSCCPARKL